MKGLILIALPAAALLTSAPAIAQFSNSDPAPGYSSLLGANYANAEREIRSADVDAYDPARSINLGIALAKQGKADEASKQFNQVLMEPDIEIVVANGSTVMSHDVAHRALAMLQSGALGR